ncbi:MAG: DUF7009 family protein [Gammaproteobacteria bacterium]
MKLRILGNSIRLRLTKSELDAIANQGEVADHVEFGGGTRLRYRIVAGAEAVPGATFADHDICVTLPAERVARWANDDEDVSIVGEQRLPAGDSLKILVEKDFECLVPRPGEDPRDLFDNPKKV